MWLLRHEDALVRLVAGGRIGTLMIPVQSGSPRLLRLMRRNPDVEGFARAVGRLRRARRRTRLATQVIIGFPTEAEADHELTATLLRRCAFDEVDLLQYHETTSTDSAALSPKIPSELARQRIRRLMLTLPPWTIVHPLYDGLRAK